MEVDEELDAKYADVTPKWMVSCMVPDVEDFMGQGPTRIH
jgi:hypothetical protein